MAEGLNRSTKKTSFVRALKNKLGKLTMSKTPASPKNNCRKKGSNSRIVPPANTPTTCTRPPAPKKPPAPRLRPTRPPPPKIPTVRKLAPMPPLPPVSEYPVVPLPSAPPLPRTPSNLGVCLPSLPKSFVDSIATVSSLSANLRIPFPSISSLPTMPDIEAFLETPLQFVASLLPSSVKNSTYFTSQASEGNASGMTQPESRASCSSAQDFFNFLPPSLSLPTAFYNLSDLPFLGMLCGPAAKTISPARRTQPAEGYGRSKKIRREEPFDPNFNLTSDQINQLLDQLIVNCDCSVNPKLQQQLAELQRKLIEKSSSDENLCKICMESPMDCVLLECGHMVSCLKCGHRLAQCPICRQVVVRIVRTYIS